MRYLFLLFIFAANVSLAQSELSFVNSNGDQFLPGIVQFKVKGEHRAFCDVDAVRIPEFTAFLETVNAMEVSKMFPRELPPAKEFNDRGQRLADISLIYELKVPEDTDIPEVVRKMNALGLLEYAEPKFVSHDMFSPNDAGLISVNPYHFMNVEAYDAWDVTQGDTNVVIGITDTSFDVNHEDLSGNIKYNYDDPVGNGDDDNDGYTDNFAGWDVVDNDNDLFNYNEIHGTAVAAISSASTNNGIGYAGLGFKCKFLPVKVSINASPHTVTKGYEGIQYCVEQGCSVINCSWGNTTFSQTAQDIITWAAINNDVVIVAAAGNVTSTQLYYPASYNYALSVTGVNANDIFNDGVLSPFVSNDSVDVSAPGYSVYTTATYGGNPLYSPPQGGTSMAAPIVAGIAGLVRSQFPCLSALEVIEQIKATADNIDGITENVPYAGTIGDGRVNAFAAVSGTLCDPIGMSNALMEADRFTIYPNPTRDRTVIKTDRAADWEVQLFDSSGKLVLSERFQGKRIALTDLPSGFYVVKLSDGQMMTSKKLIVTD